MNPFRSIGGCITRYALFVGRAPRPEFWWWALLQAVVTSLLSLNGPPGALDLWLLATITPTLAVAVRRLRDAGCSWVLLLLAVVPILNVTVLYFLSLPSASVRVEEPLPAAAAQQ